MTYTVTELPAMTIIGFKTSVDLKDMSSAKLDACHQMERQKERLLQFAKSPIYYGANFVEEHSANYLAGVEAASPTSSFPGLETIPIPAGLYAIFITSEHDRPLLDQFIGKCYEELTHDETFMINGNYNLETITQFIDGHSDFSVFIPVKSKK